MYFLFGNFDVLSSQVSDIVQETASSKPRVYIHIGPPKTGSTSLQATLKQHEKDLKADNFLQLTYKDAPGIYQHDQGVSANLAVCLCKYEDKKCDDDVLRSTFPAFLESVGNNNVIISSEFFYTERCDFSRMANLFKGFDVRVIMVYRPFHSWLRSIHYQDSLGKIGAGVATKPFIEFASTLNINENVKHFKTFESYEHTFGKGSIKVMDMEKVSSGGGLVEEFLCNYIYPKPTQTCEKIRKVPPVPSQNVAIPVDYVRLADTAAKKGLMGKTYSDPIVTKCVADEIQKWWEGQKKTLGDLPKSCLSVDQFKSLKQWTVDIHSEMSSYVDTDLSMSELEADIENIRTDLCSVKVTSVVGLAAWKKKLSTLKFSCKK